MLLFTLQIAAQANHDINASVPSENNGLCLVAFSNNDSLLNAGRGVSVK